MDTCFWLNSCHWHDNYPALYDIQSTPGNWKQNNDIKQKNQHIPLPWKTSTYSQLDTSKKRIVPQNYSQPQLRSHNLTAMLRPSSPHLCCCHSNSSSPQVLGNIGLQAGHSLTMTLMQQSSGDRIRSVRRQCDVKGYTTQFSWVLPNVNYIMWNLYPIPSCPAHLIVVPTPSVSRWPSSTYWGCWCLGLTEWTLISQRSSGWQSVFFLILNSISPPDVFNSFSTPNIKYTAMFKNLTNSELLWF